ASCDPGLPQAIAIDDPVQLHAVAADTEGARRAALDLQQRRRVEGGRHGKGLVAPTREPAFLAQAQNGVTHGAAATLESSEGVDDPHAIAVDREHAREAAQPICQAVGDPTDRRSRNDEAAEPRDIGPPAIANAVEQAHANRMRGADMAATLASPRRPGQRIEQPLRCTPCYPRACGASAGWCDGSTIEQSER